MIRSVCMYSAFIFALTACGGEYHGRPVEGAPRLPPTRAAGVKLLASVPPGRTFRPLAWVGVCIAGTPDDAARALRAEAAAYGATAVADVRLAVGLPHGACQPAIVQNDEPDVALEGVAGTLE